jgi:hypothetical protein
MPEMEQINLYLGFPIHVMGCEKLWLFNTTTSSIAVLFGYENQYSVSNRPEHEVSYPVAGTFAVQGATACDCNIRARH